MRNTVAIIQDNAICYPEECPFDPPDNYPEFEGTDVQRGGPNTTYEAVRELFQLQGLDAANLNTPRWNPLSDIIRPGDSILVKPNLVLHEMGATRGTDCVTTHASVLRPIIDYCLLAGGSECSVVIGDVPLQSADFDDIVRANGLRDLVSYYQSERSANVQLIDLRPMRQISNTEGFFFEETVAQAGDPKGYSTVEVGADSWLEPLCERGQPRFAVADYEADETVKHHKKGTHQYYICNTALKADVFINVPKLKTHEKAGITVNLKNLVGINGDKSWLPHFRRGSRSSGGDEWDKRSFRKGLHYQARRMLQGRNKLLWLTARRLWHLMRPAKAADALATASSEVFEMGGAWHGNDTVWRTVLDLNAIINFYSLDRGWCDERVRRYFFVVDGIVAGEGHGPLFPTPKPVGCLMSGFDQVCGDIVAATAMGFDWRKIPLLRGAMESPRFPLTPHTDVEEILIATRDGIVRLDELGLDMGFEPAPAWKGSIESSPRVVAHS